MLTKELLDKSSNWISWLDQGIKKLRQIKWIAHVERHNNTEVRNLIADIRPYTVHINEDT